MKTISSVCQMTALKLHAAAVLVAPGNGFPLNSFEC